MHSRGQTDGLDGVGHGSGSCQFQQSHVVVHVGGIECWVNDDILDGDDQGSDPRAQHGPQAHGPVGWARITVGAIVSMSLYVCMFQ